MSDLQIIEQTLTKVASRRRKERALRGFWQGVLVGSIVWLVALIIYKLAPIPPVYLKVSIGIAIAIPIIGLIAGAWRKNSVDETARWVDSRVKLQERLSSALEFSHTVGQQERWRELLVSDAANHAKEIDAKKLVNFRVPKATRWALLMLALAVGLGFLPEYRSKAYVQKQADSKIIKEAGKQLMELTKRNLTNRPPALETTQKSMDAVHELGSELARKTLTRSEALQKIANVTEKLGNQLNEASKDPAMKRLEQAARTPGGQTSPEAAKMQKQIAEAQKQLGNNNATPDDMQKMQNDLNKMQQEAAKAANDNGGKMSQADKEKLSKSMAGLSKQAQDLGVPMPNLDQAMEALAANQTDMMLKDLKQATFDLEKTKEMAKNLAQMQQQMEKMGKDLAEQLKNGQPDAAQSTLDEMTKQLQASNLTPEQLKKLLSDVSKAVDPAGKYGDVSKSLKDAANKMKDGDKANAAKSLAKASDELKKLQEQMGDADSLSAELQALNTASMSVSTAQSWGKCQGNKPGMGQGGKPGKGVGTWADENSGWDYAGQSADHWDNSGVVRPDRDPKGTTERPADLNDALKPTKVKGQFIPGGPMPSITLKGVSIKGQSKVAYEEAAVAAQAEAQSALSQEKVPRAYQAPVRDYFDDLKK